MAKLKTALAALAPMALAACATSNAPSSPPAAAAAAARAPQWRVADIAGKSAAALDETLGAPDLVRVEGAGEFRRYRLAECSLIVILYPDENGEKRAQSLDAGALKSGEEKPDLDECLAAGRAAPQADDPS